MDVQFLQFTNEAGETMNCVHQNDAARILGLSVATLKLRGMDFVGSDNGVLYFRLEHLQAELQKLGRAVGTVEMHG